MKHTILAMTVLLVAAGSLGGCTSHTRDDADAGDALDAEFPADHPCNTHDTFCGYPDTFVRHPCDDQDALGEGACEAVLGYAWRGGTCAPISGCSCVGVDCGAVSSSASACLDAHRLCRRSCGGLAGLDGCLPVEFCDYPDGSFCGGDDSTGTCTSRPSDCLEPGGVPVCGCDGLEYLSDCSAYLAGTDVRDLGPCP